jgi:PAS domain S-box-containing protein
LNTDFYLAYFLIIFFASIAKSFKLLVINALVVCGVYGWFLWMKGMGIEELERGILLRIPFIFIISLFYGFLIQSFEKKTRRIKKELKELKESEQQYRQIVEGAHDAVAILDEKRKVKFFNLRLLQLTQYKPEELTRIDLAKLLDGSGKGFIEDLIGRIGSGKEPALQEMDIYRKNGEKRRVEVSAAQFLLPDQKAHTIIYFKDITARSQNKENLIRSDTLRTPGGTKTGVSQDANNVLEAILSEVLLTKLGGMGKEGKEKESPDESHQKELGIIEILLKSMEEIPEEEESLRLKKELKRNANAKP